MFPKLISGFSRLVLGPDGPLSTQGGPDGPSPDPGRDPESEGFLQARKFSLLDIRLLKKSYFESYDPIGYPYCLVYKKYT